MTQPADFMFSAELSQTSGIPKVVVKIEYIGDGWVVIEDPVIRVEQVTLDGDRYSYGFKGSSLDRVSYPRNLNMLVSTKKRAVVNFPLLAECEVDNAFLERQNLGSVMVQISLIRLISTDGAGGVEWRQEIYSLQDEIVDTVSRVKPAAKVVVDTLPPENNGIVDILPSGDHSEP